LLSGKNHIIFTGGSQEKAVVLGSCNYYKIEENNVVKNCYLI